MNKEPLRVRQSKSRYEFRQKKPPTRSVSHWTDFTVKFGSSAQPFFPWISHDARCSIVRLVERENEQQTSAGRVACSREFETLRTKSLNQNCFTGQKKRHKTPNNEKKAQSSSFCCWFEKAERLPLTCAGAHKSADEIWAHSHCYKTPLMDEWHLRTGRTAITSAFPSCFLFNGWSGQCRNYTGNLTNPESLAECGCCASR